MFVLSVNKISKRFVRHWLFRDFSLEVTSGARIAITGPNGSGKSSLLQILIGVVPVTEGEISIQVDSQVIHPDAYFRWFAMASPAFELPEHLTLRQFLAFHLPLKPLRNRFTISQLADLMNLKPHLDKDLVLFSSGMRQRVKLALALLADVPLILLDEPGSHLDQHYFGWYRDLLAQVPPTTSVVIASNDPAEYEGFDQVIEISQFMPS